MWRRINSSQLQSLTSSSASRSASRIAGRRFLVSRSCTAPTSFLARHFSADAGNEDPKPVKKVINIRPTVTGHEREELEALREGRDLFDIDHPVGPFGTEEEPAIVKSVYDKRIVGCPGGEGEDEHDVVWFWLEKGKPHVCPVCSQYFMLEVVGKGGEPYGPKPDYEDEEE